jgi:hypothetical protein
MMTRGYLDLDRKEDIVLDFGVDSGVWTFYNNSTWSHLHKRTAISMTSGDLDGNGNQDIIIDFGSGLGIWSYFNDSSWNKLQ